MSADDDWIISNPRHDAHALGQHNSVFAVSNGYLGLTGNVGEDRDGRQPVTLINGVYDELDMFSLIRASNQDRRYLDSSYFDSAGKSPAVANLPNPLSLRAFVGGREASLMRGEVSNFRQSLRLDTGEYFYSFDFHDAAGRTTRIAMGRCASIVHPHRVFMRYALTLLDHQAPIRVLSGIDGTIRSNTAPERQYHVVALHAEPVERCLLDARTRARGIDIHVGVLNRCTGPVRPASIRAVIEHDAVYTAYEFTPERGEAITIDRFIALTCSEDARHGVAADISAELDAAAATGYDAALEENARHWAELWRQADVRIDGDPVAQKYMRFCLYHVVAAAPRFTDRLSVPVKLLSGEHYQGNTFYDTDLYILPFYSFVFPQYARTCLNFRCKGLTPGRAIARELGYEGAKLAWQAGPHGEECLGKWWRFTRTNIHVNSDAAYALMHYWRATGDDAFLRERGIDLLVETARFCAARAVHDAARDAYDIHDVAGPDEGHCESTNNFYTNYLAIRNLRWAAEAVARLQSADPAAFAGVAERLGLHPEEPRRWAHVADRLTLLFDPRTKLYEQCHGFFELLPVPPIPSRGRAAWFETVHPYQALNQPDVVMAMVLFRDEFDAEVRRTNWEFYKDKSLNFSSMSFAVSAIMAADMGELGRAYEDFIVSAGMDLDEELTGRRDTDAGLHGTAMGGAWMAAVLGFGGLHSLDQGLRLNPNLPPRWLGLRFNLVLHGERVAVAIDRRQVRFEAGAERSAEIPISVGGRAITLKSGQTMTVPHGAEDDRTA